jgi:hypothetical protein
MGDRYVSIDGDWRIREVNDAGREAVGAAAGQSVEAEQVGLELWSVLSDSPGRGCTGRSRERLRQRR